MVLLPRTDITEGRNSLSHSSENNRAAGSVSPVSTFADTMNHHGTNDTIVCGIFHEKFGG